MTHPFFLQAGSAQPKPHNTHRIATVASCLLMVTGKVQMLAMMSSCVTSVSRRRPLRRTSGAAPRAALEREGAVVICRHKAFGVGVGVVRDCELGMIWCDASALGIAPMRYITRTTKQLELVWCQPHPGPGGAWSQCSGE